MMKVIGLIGGMSWNSTLEYYRLINELVAENSALLQRTEDAWPAIVDRITFTQAQAKL